MALEFRQRLNRTPLRSSQFAIVIREGESVVLSEVELEA